MNGRGPGLWITGPSRSGTSMIAGLFAEHGVFFGRTVEGDEHNEKGYFEHPELVDRVESGIWAGWPEAWWKTLRSEGYESGLWWGVKRGPQAWPWIQELGPELIIVCKRPVMETIRSRRRCWPLKSAPGGEIRRTREALGEIVKVATCPVFTINTERVVAGDYGRLNKAFKHLGLWMSVELVDAWIDRSLWDRGPEVQEATAR